MNRHRLCANRAIGPNQMAHGVNDLSVNHVNGRNLYNPALKITGFGVDYTQHGSLLAVKTLA
ncbi:hypothetical protein D3C76_1462530 [compost metagenome]